MTGVKIWALDRALYNIEAWTGAWLRYLSGELFHGLGDQHGGARIRHGAVAVLPGLHQLRGHGLEVVRHPAQLRALRVCVTDGGVCAVGKRWV